MNEWWNLLPASGWERLAADAAWQSTAIAAGALVAAWLVRRRPALRAAILLSVAALSLAVPLLSTIVRSSGGGLLAPPVRADHWPAAVAHSVPAAASAVAIADPASHSTVAPVIANPPSVDWAGRPWRWFVGCWLAASGYLAFRLLRGVFAVRRWIRLATPCRDPKIEAALWRATLAIGVRQPELLWSSAFDSPALVVLGRTRLLLPSEMPADVDWFAVFCHELAHRARRDDLSRLVIELTLIALPWQPLLWLVRRRFRAACEEACDDWAVAAGADPVEFASLLVALVPERRPAFALGMAESPSATRHRILRLLAMKRTVSPQLGIMAGVAGWVVAITLAITLAMLQTGSAPPPGDSSHTLSAGGGLNPVIDSSGQVRGYFQEAIDSSGQVRGYHLEVGAAPQPPWGNTPLAEAVASAAAALPKSAGPPPSYVIETPDILLIDAIKLVPKSPYHIEPLDVLQIHVANPLIEAVINGPYPVDPAGSVELGPAYGKVSVAGQTVDEARKTIETHLSTILADPKLAVSLSQTSGQQQIAGEHLVGPDGTVNLGTYGIVYVAGLTIPQIKAAVEAQLSNYLEQPRVSVEVFAYNSKVYYVVIEGLSEGDRITRVPITGKESVLDALAQPTEKIPKLANCWVWISRPPAGNGSENRILPVDWQAVLTGSNTTSNWQIQPGDRIFVRPKGETARARPELSMPMKTTGGTDIPPQHSAAVSLPAIRQDPDAPSAAKMWNLLGLKLENLSPQQVRVLQPTYRGGMLVTAIRPGSQAFQCGIQPGHVLVSLQDEDTASIEDVAYALNQPDFAEHQPAAFGILRNIESRFQHFPPPVQMREARP